MLSLVVESGSYSLVAALGLIIAVAFLVAGFRACGLSSCGTQA